MSLKLPISAVSILALFTSCVSQGHSPVAYDVMLVSAASESVSEVQAKLGEFRAAVGVMPVGTTAILRSFNRPFSSEAIVYWKKDGDDSHWRANVQRLQWERIPVAARAGGRLRFTLRVNDLEVAFVAKDGKLVTLGDAKFEPISPNEAPSYWR